MNPLSCGGTGAQLLAALWFINVTGFYCIGGHDVSLSIYMINLYHIYIYIYVKIIFYCILLFKIVFYIYINVCCYSAPHESK